MAIAHIKCIKTQSKAFQTSNDIRENIILIDDLVDSKWTLTVAGGLLHKAGAEKIYPFCLADSSQSEG